MMYSNRVFQSLFWWNSLSDGDTNWFCVTRAACFNPCFGGTPFQTVCVGARPGPPRGFNPCFGGTPFQTPRVGSAPPANTSFNPCFGGTPFQTLDRVACLWPDLQFQSLFWWNSLSDPISLSRA